MNPFPPVLLAHRSACLIAQSYISSHPCSALFLLDPPATTTSPSLAGMIPEGGAVKEFDFEARFPIGVMLSGGEERERKWRAEGPRLGGEGTGKVEVLRVDGQGGGMWRGNEGRIVSSECCILMKTERRS